MTLITDGPSNYEVTWKKAENFLFFMKMLGIVYFIKVLN